MSKYEILKLIILSIFCLLALIIFNNYSENGRYVLKKEGLIVLDSRNGKLYKVSAQKVVNVVIFEEENNSEK